MSALIFVTIVFGSLTIWAIGHGFFANRVSWRAFDTKHYREFKRQHATERLARHHATRFYYISSGVYFVLFVIALWVYFRLR